MTFMSTTEINASSQAWEELQAALTDSLRIYVTRKLPANPASGWTACEKRTGADWVYRTLPLT